MDVLRATGIEQAYGDRAILRGCDLVVEAGEKIGLVGVNGSGKSTLLKILGGAERADHGDVIVRGRMALMEQDPVLPGATVGESADEAVRWHAELLAAFHEASHAGDLKRVAELHARLDDAGWELGHRVDAMLSRVGAPARSAVVARLSGGERRRVALARALLGQPEILLLDEPTNHLDGDTVEWLQGFLQSYRGTVILVTHDRYMLEAVSTRIVEVEDGRCVSYDGSYTDYLIERAERRRALERADDERMRMIAREAEWASRCPAAQTTKQKARLGRLSALQDMEALRRYVPIELDLRSGIKHGSTVVELRKVRKQLGERAVCRDLDVALRAGDRLGILGPNGAGKTTILKLITGELKPDKGEIVRGSRVRMAFFDQERTGLDPSWTVYEAAGDGNDQVKVGEHWIHVASFLGRFHFGREYFTQRVAALSGGERARLLLARLLLQGANLLLMDEPTNDLDLQTLRVLEEALLAYDGVLVVVTHDRAFLDRVCNAVLTPEGDGRWTRYAERAQIPAKIEEKVVAKVVSQVERPKTRLSFKEQKEKEELPRRIEAAEGEQARLHALLADPATWKDPKVDAAALNRQLADVEAEIERLFDRWAALEG